MFAHPGVLKFLEKIGAQKYISEIWGASGGAIVGLLYSMGVAPDRIAEEGLRSLKAQRDFEIIPTYFSVFRKIIWESFFPNLSLLRDHEKQDSLIQGFHDCQKGMQNFVAKLLKGGEPKYSFYCLAYNMDTQQTDVLTNLETSQEFYPNFYQTDLQEAIVASSSIPILFVPKVIDDKNGRRVYVDGSTVEDVPSESIYKKWVRDRELGLEKRRRLLVITVNFFPYFTSIGLLENWVLRKFPGFQYLLLSAKYADLMRQARTKVQKDLLREDPSVELWDISMDMPKGGGLMNVHTIPAVIKIGEKACVEHFEEINDSLLS